jgi:hypothetical protein
MAGEPPVPEVLEAETTDPPAYPVPYHAPSGSTAIVAGANAAERIVAATEIATQLDKIIAAQGLRTKIGSKRVKDENGRDKWVDNFHIDIEGWQTLAAFLELAVVPRWSKMVTDPATGEPLRARYTVRREIFAKGTRKEAIKDGSAIVERVETAEVDGFSWEARVEVFKDGALVSAGESMCTREEEGWRDAEDQRLRSMAQTRAASKAIAGVARWIVSLAGYAAGTDEPSAPAGASPELLEAAHAALSRLVDDDADLLALAAQRLNDQFGDEAPAIAAQTIVIVEQVRRRLTTAPRAQAPAAAAADPAADLQDAAATDAQDSLL